MTGRKSQLEKFNSRVGKMHKDEEVIKKAEIKNSTVEKQAEKIVSKFGLSTEDIFAIITHESIGGFVKLWNNSMEDVVRKSMRTEMKDIVREVIQEEMVSAYKGILRGINDFKSAVNIELEPEEVLEDNIVEFELEQKEYKIQSVASVVAEPKVNKIIFDKSATAEEIIVKLHQEGIDPIKGKNMVLQGSKAITLYNTFMRNHKGERGAWKDYVLSILNNLQ